MAEPASLSEGRKIGRSIYLVGCVTIGLQAYGIRMAEGEHFPLRLPEDFPIAGVFALILAFLSVSLIARNAEQLAYFLGSSASQLQLAEIEPTVDLGPANKYKVDSKHPLRAAIIDLAPRIGTAISRFTYFIDQILPVVFALLVIIDARSSLVKLKSYSYNPVIVNRSEGEATMSQPSPLSIARRFGQRVSVSRWTNPDGSCGGLVSSTASVPTESFVPFDTLIDDGVKIEPGVAIPARSILMKDGKVVKNTVQMLPK